MGKRMKWGIRKEDKIWREAVEGSRTWEIDFVDADFRRVATCIEKG